MIRLHGLWMAPLLAGMLGCLPVSATAARPACGKGSICRLEGEVNLDLNAGMLVLNLATDACALDKTAYDGGGHKHAVHETCAPFPYKDWSEARLITPWQQQLRATQFGPDWVGFALDFRGADIDPLAADADERLERPWTIIALGAKKQKQWSPDPQQRAAMLVLVGEATSTQITVAEVKQPPSLVVQDFHNEGELRNGASAQLVLTVANAGLGSAYRVIARTRSNIPELHGLQFSFGQLNPKETKTRRVRVNLPRDNDEKEALIVLVVEEAHQFAPEPSSRRFEVKPAALVARLSMSCRLLGYDGPKPRVDAGQVVHVDCNVRNEGARAVGVRVSAELTGVARAVETEPFDLDTAKQSSVNLALQVPKGAALDSELTLMVRARQTGSKAVEQVALALVVARPKICPNGKITRAEFAKKRSELRGTLDAGLISKEEYDRYEAELVGCLE